MQHIQTFTTTLLTATMALSVILAGVHAKDLVTPQTGKVLAARSSDDISKKAVSELHNHIEKVSTKSFGKTTADYTAIADRRSLKHQLIEDIVHDEQTVFQHMWFLLRFAVALRL